MFDRATIIEKNFREALLLDTLPEIDPKRSLSDAGLTLPELVQFFDIQLMVRHTDLLSRRTKGETFYSIGSSGHDAMAAVAWATRLSDMAFLHYRDAAFQLARQKMLAESGEADAHLHDLLLSFAASSDDPVSGGRHKVLGGKKIFIPPQTSTIASHLPKAVGAAHSVALAGNFAEMPKDSVVICSFGDASANHSTAQGAINASLWATYQHSPMPLVFVCEDNGIGISVRTPMGWTEANFKNRPGLKYIKCDGRYLHDTFYAAKQAIDYARSRRRPVFLHVKTVRLMGHAGADIEAAYTKSSEIAAQEAQDPLLVTAALLRREGLPAKKLLKANDTMAARIARIAPRVFARPKLTRSKDVLSSLLPKTSAHRPSPAKPTPQERRALFENDARQLATPLPLARHIGFGLADGLLRHKNAFLFGEDVARKGGVYGVTNGLLEKFGPRRVQDTLLDEQTILGMAIGAAHNGMLPIPEIQFLAYVHNAEDQIRGEAATLSFFSNSQYTNPMVIRIAGLGYQKGFGGHFHNDNSINIFRDIPGIIVVCPSAPEDAAPLLHRCLKLAHEERRIVIFLEPIALYQTTDLHETGDKKWLSPYKAPNDQAEIKFGDVGLHGRGTDLAILTYGNGHYMSRRVAERISSENIKSRVIDLRWLSPLPMDDILKSIKSCKNILIVDECRKTGSLGEELFTRLKEEGASQAIARLNSEDSFIPLGAAANTVLLSEEDIANAARALVKGKI